ncbi:hypothetical protein BDN72DRAFT_834524 [Pluteus cervinus]|uniref:Uncharacterized protein n=1 Tax=Pluteus cervinus TaxID=181527 RepID=A0ACD3B5Q1_9AGAR|nr:hypothetical protein BDN72DRAFT_834524 [Pluteus cervinus]
MHPNLPWSSTPFSVFPSSSFATSPTGVDHPFTQNLAPSSKPSGPHLGGVRVLDPPRTRDSSLPVFKGSVLTSYSGNTDDTPITSFATEPETTHPLGNFERQPASAGDRAMPSKRRSLQAILIPSLRHSSASPPPNREEQNYTGTRMRSQSLADQAAYFPPLPELDSYSQSSVVSVDDGDSSSFLLDEDPFAASAPRVMRTPPPSPTPNSTFSIPRPPPATVKAASDHVSCPPCPPSPLALDSTKSFALRSVPTSPRGTGHFPPISPRVRPATSRPAFAARPSLPSLSTLANMNIVITKKLRKGRVGAGLPHEPWDMDDSSGYTSSSQSSQKDVPFPSTQILAPSSSAQSFVSDLELDFMDVSQESEDGTSSQPSASRSQDDEDDTLLPYAFQNSTQPAPGTQSGDSPPPALRPSLTRSTSMTSTSSSGSYVPGDYGHTSNSSHYGPNDISMSSTESENEILNSPPDDYFSFPRYRSNSYSSLSLDGPFMTDDFAESSYLSEPDLLYQPGTSADTIRPRKRSNQGSRSPFSSSLSLSQEPVDGSDWDQRGHNSSYGGYQGSSSSGAGGSRPSGSNQGGGGGFSGWSNGQGVGGSGGDDGRDNRRRGGASRSTFSTPSSSDETSDETDEESTDDYGDPEVPTRTKANVSGSDDDVPLAQRIPTALTAQQTIRRQVREERDQKRREKVTRTTQGVNPRLRQETLRPAGSGDYFVTSALSSSQEAALQATRAPPATRVRTQTMPSRPFAPEELVKKLQGVQLVDPSPSTSREHYHRPSVATSKDTSERTSRLGGQSHPHSPQPIPAPDLPWGLRPSRSFHRPDARLEEQPRPTLPPIPVPRESDSSKIGRSVTSVTRPRPRDHSQSATSKPRSVPAPSAFADYFPSFRPSGEERERVKLQKPYPESKSTRTSSEVERPPRPSISRPPIPPLPTDAMHSPVPPARSQQIVQGGVVPVSGAPGSQSQRIFIGDMQRFNMVELDATTTAGSVIETIEAQGSLKGWAGAGGWMLFEVAQDFGMERPIRSYELLSDVMASWNKDKMVNTFLLKLTPLANPLSRNAMPSSSPMHTGFVEWESKRGKWSKRYLQLREHSLWLSKRESKKDETFLCSLSNFDAYYVTRPHKAPKQFVFAVKSTDNPSFFENAADYLHVFSCSQREGEAWMERILLARSYVLHQERTVLFNPKGSTSVPPSSSATPLSRSGTRKGRPVQPLVTVAAPFAMHPTTNGDVFEKGSLLHKLPTSHPS